MEDQELPGSLPGQAEPEPTSEPEMRIPSVPDKNKLPPVQTTAPKPSEPLSADHDTKENKLDEAKSEGLNDEDVEDLKTFSDADDQGQGELDDFYNLLVECWEDVDTEGADFVSIADLGKIMNSLLNDEVIDFYNPEDLEMLAADMDADGRRRMALVLGFWTTSRAKQALGECEGYKNRLLDMRTEHGLCVGYIPKLEFLDVLFRKQHGHAVQMDSSELGRKFVKLAKTGIDFTDKELEEAFKVFSLNEERFGAKNIRAVMMAVDEMDVSAYDARKMIEAAVTTQESIEQESITFEEFKKMIMWTPEDEENL